MTISIPECANIDDDTLLQAVQITRGVNNQESSILVLKLVNCGRSLTDKVAVSLIDHCQTIEVLQLTGCYKLSDIGLTQLLTATSMNSLRSLDLSFNSRLSSQGIAVLRTLSGLESLTLNDCTQLSDDDLLQLLPEYHPNSSKVSEMKSLRHLSLSGLIDISDKSIVEIVKGSSTY